MAGTAEIVMSVLGGLAVVCSQVVASGACSKSRDELDGKINFHFDRAYILRKMYPDFNIRRAGKFKVDVDGLFIYLNKRMCDLLGMDRSDLFFRAIYSANVYNGQVYRLEQAWIHAISTFSPIVIRHCHMVKSKMVYLITEAYPVMSSTNLPKGMKGVTVRVSKQFFEQFNEQKALSNIHHYRLHTTTPRTTPSLYQWTRRYIT